MKSAQKRQQPQAQELGKLIRAYRIAKVLTQKEVAQKIGIGERQVEAWEAGDSIPRPNNFHKLENAILPFSSQQNNDENIALRKAYIRAWATRYEKNGRPCGS